MLYVTKVKGDLISVIDTEDAVEEQVTKEELLDIVYNKGIKVARVLNNEFKVLTPITLRDAYMFDVLENTYSAFRRTGFSNDTEMIDYLVRDFENAYDSVRDERKTPVFGCNKRDFIKCCLIEFYRKYGNISIDVVRCGSVQAKCVYSCGLFKIYKESAFSYYLVY